MNSEQTNWKLVGIVVGIGVLVLLLLLFLLSRVGGSSGSNGFGLFGTIGNRILTSTGSNTGTNASSTVVSPNQAVPIIFKIADGPVAGASFTQTQNPTTTLARYVMQDNGHVFDMPMDVPGAAARIVSNVTIPGMTNIEWEPQGVGMLGQYIDNATIKTIHLSFPAASTTLAVIQPPTIKFFPDEISSIALSPNGTQAAYLLNSAAGALGYIAANDGSKPTRLFSIPLSQVLLAWPSKSTLLAQSKSAAGVPGIAFSIQTTTGAVTELLYTLGLSVNASPDFANMVYQTVPADGTARQVYVHNAATGRDTLLSFQPAPERCIWSPISTVVMYCAVPLQYTPPNYLDLWHQGTASSPDSIIGYNAATRVAIVVAGPGGTDGGVQTNIAQMAISSDAHYLLFISKGDRTLWGVRLTQ